MNIKERFVEGKQINDNDFESAIEEWHEDKDETSPPIWDYLGITQDEYARWVNGESVNSLLGHYKNMAQIAPPPSMDDSETEHE